MERLYELTAMYLSENIWNMDERVWLLFESTAW